MQGKNAVEVAAGLDGLDQSTAIWQNEGTVHKKYSLIVCFSAIFAVVVAQNTNRCGKVFLNQKKFCTEFFSDFPLLVFSLATSREDNK